MTSAGTTTFDYDARGNLWHRTSGSNVTTYAYNAADQLTGVSAPGINATYGYDADGRRVKQTVGSAVTNYLWDEASPYGDVVYEYNGSGSPLASYVSGGTQLISQTRGSTTNYFLQDGQNSTRALTNSSGTITDTYAYTAFGEIFNQSGTTTNSYLYTGQQYDSLTGLYSLRARYYNPALGRFLSQDMYPVNFGNTVELNRYVYTANSPINLTDPSGHFAVPSLGITLKSVALRSLVIATAIYFGVVAVYKAVGVLLYAVDVPRVLPKMKTIEQINMEQQQQELQELLRKIRPNPGPSTDPKTEPEPTKVPPILPSPQPSPTPKEILIVGEEDFGYTTALAALHPDWYITSSTYGDGSNNQIVLGTTGNITLISNVDATGLDEIGTHTSLNRYDAVIFNAPKADSGGPRASGDLVDAVMASAIHVLKPGGQMRFSVSGGMLAWNRLYDNVRSKRYPGYSYGYRIPYFADSEFGVPYVPLRTGGSKPIGTDLQDYFWYIFVK